MEIDLGGKRPHELAAADADLMRLWGEVNNAWDEIERLLYDAFDALLMTADQFVTHAVFYSQKSHAARRDMVEESAKVRLRSNPDLQKKLASALKRVKARSGDRNKLAHGTWVVSVNFPAGTFEIARMAFEADQMQQGGSYDRHKLAHVRDEMKDTAKALRDAIEPLTTERRRVIGMQIKQNLADALGGMPTPSPDKSHQ